MFIKYIKYLYVYFHTSVTKFINNNNNNYTFLM